MFWWIVIGCLSRLIIHIPDATPITTLALFAPMFYSLRQSIFIIIAMVLSSDLLLHFLSHYAIFGTWSFFTYSGWIGVIFLGKIYCNTCGRVGLRLFFYAMIASIVFWIWTNFGTWCTTTLYPHTFLGFISCYIAAIPFLKNSLIGTMCWSVVAWAWLHQADRNVHFMRRTTGISVWRDL